MPRKRTTWSIQDAKNQFSSVVEAAQRTPQVVTKHGKAAVVVWRPTNMRGCRPRERLDAPRFVDHLLAMPTDDGGFERLQGRLRDAGP
jgi:antitoxin (DNA-binding transcriptional repressor) of toxin-antitoxin stability system